MKGTFTIHGERVRVQSQRRYIVFTFKDYDMAWHIIKRSDSLDTVRRYINARDYTVLDTVTGETVR
jgi:hypothetical protein